MLHVVLLEHTGEELSVHSPQLCRGHVCPVHNMSAHHMRGFRQTWRDDLKRMQRVCLHGYAHPDPDHLKSVRRRFGVNRMWIEGMHHPCDGCCVDNCIDGEVVSVVIVREVTSSSAPALPASTPGESSGEPACRPPSSERPS